MYLDRPIRGLATQSVRPIITHTDFIPEASFHLHMRHGVHLQRRFPNEETQHFDLRVEFYERELNRLVVGEGATEGTPGVGVGDGGRDAVGGGAEGGGGLAEAVFVREGVGDGEAGVEGAEEGGGGGPEVEGDGGVVGGHVEGPVGLAVTFVVMCLSVWLSVYLSVRIRQDR